QYKAKYPGGQAPQGGGAPSGGAEPPVTFSGTGATKTKPFSLRGGNYVSTWRAHDPADHLAMGCFHTGFLESADPSSSVMFDLRTKIVDPGRSASGTAPLPGLKPGKYCLDMSSGCAWTVTISPQK